MKEQNIFSFELLFRVRCDPKPFTPEEIDHWIEWFDEMLDECVIKAHPQIERRFNLTDKGEAWVKAILKTPLPRQVWIDQCGRVLE